MSPPNSCEFIMSITFFHKHFQDAGSKMAVMEDTESLSLQAKNIYQVLGGGPTVGRQTGGTPGSIRYRGSGKEFRGEDQWWRGC